MSRSAAEDAIIALLEAEFPEGVKIGSMPLGLDEPKALDFPNAAVWVVYAGGPAGASIMMGAHVQPQTWAWAVYPLAKRYRSSQERQSGALELMEQVEEILAGAFILDAPLMKVRDQVAPVAPGKGVFGYELLFTLEQDIRRMP